MRLAAALLALAACDGAKASVSARDCEDVLAHLIVLERDSTPVMCRYHPDCGGDDEDAFLATCPKVLARRELRCYQRATTVTAADACLDRVAFAERIETGEVEDGAEVSGRAWRGFDPLAAKSPIERAMAQLGDLRDDACACHDAGCAATIEARFRTLVERWSAVFDDKMEPDEAQKAEGERISRQYFDCLEAAKN